MDFMLLRPPKKACLPVCSGAYWVVTLVTASWLLGTGEAVTGSASLLRSNIPLQDLPSQGQPSLRRPATLGLVAEAPAVFLPSHNSSFAEDEGDDEGSVRAVMGNAVAAAELGTWALAAKLGIMGRALLQVLTETTMQLQRGNLTGAMDVISETYSKAQRASQMVDAQTTGAAQRSIGIILVFVFIIACWGLELFISKRQEERAEEEKQPPPQTDFLPAFCFARFLMAWFVVASNFYGQGPAMSEISHTWVVFANWGLVIGTPWFFLLSGFCHTYQVLISAKPDSSDDFVYAMIRRVAPWYPLYVLSLTWCALRIWSHQAEDWAHYMASLLLIQGFIFDKEGFPHMLGDWWLSFLMVYLLVWTPMQQILNSSTSSVIWTLFTIAFLLVIPSSIFEWYFFEDMAPWRLIQYSTAFIFGQGLATWYHRNCMISKSATEQIYERRPVHELPALVRFGATASFLVLGILFFIFGPNDRLPLIRKPVRPLVEKGGLLPVLGLLTASLACEVDPISRLFARMPFRWTDKLSLTTFILQAPIYMFVSDHLGHTGLSWTFSACLFVASLLAHFAVERPWRRLLGLRVK